MDFVDKFILKETMFQKLDLFHLQPKEWVDGEWSLVRQKQQYSINGRVSMHSHYTCTQMQ